MAHYISRLDEGDSIEATFMDMEPGGKLCHAKFNHEFYMFYIYIYHRLGSLCHQHERLGLAICIQSSFSILSKILASGGLGTNILSITIERLRLNSGTRSLLIDNLVSWRSNMLEREAEASLTAVIRLAKINVEILGMQHN